VAHPAEHLGDVAAGLLQVVAQLAEELVEVGGAVGSEVA